MSVDNIPKVILHEHIEGSITPVLALRLANKHNIVLPNEFIYAPGEYSLVDYPYGRYAYNESDFSAFIQTYDCVAELIRTPDDYYEITKDFLTRNGRQGLIYCELIISPWHMARSENDALMIDREKYQLSLAAIVRAIEEAKIEFSLETRLHAVGIRHLGESLMNKVIDFIRVNPSPYLTGFNIAGDERSGVFSDFHYAHQQATQLNLGRSYHAGEICSSESVNDAINAGAMRIGHGIQAIDCPDTLNRLIKNQITLELAITSNKILVSQLACDISKHPVRALYDRGVRITLNTDDAGIFGTDIAKEYALAMHHFHFNRSELLDITLCGIEAAFVDNQTRQTLLDHVYHCFTPEDIIQLEQSEERAQSTVLAERLQQRLLRLRIGG